MLTPDQPIAPRGVSANAKETCDYAWKQVQAASVNQKHERASEMFYFLLGARGMCKYDSASYRYIKAVMAAIHDEKPEEWAA